MRLSRCKPTRLSCKAIGYAALLKQSTEPVDKSVRNVPIKAFNRHNTGLCDKLMIFSPHLETI
jgi:hypothetical protein